MDLTSKREQNEQNGAKTTLKQIVLSFTLKSSCRQRQHHLLIKHQPESSRIPCQTTDESGCAKEVYEVALLSHLMVVHG
jgi:hypothetical protein